MIKELVALGQYDMASAELRELVYLLKIEWFRFIIS